MKTVTSGNSKEMIDGNYLKTKSSKISIRVKILWLPFELTIKFSFGIVKK
jgi:hypothetical protein